MEYVTEIVRQLSADAGALRAVPLRPNRSVYCVGDRFHYYEVRTEGRARQYHLVVVQRTAELEATLRRARDGASVADLAAALADSEISAGDAEAFVRELVTAQLLVPELEPAVTGGDPARVLAGTLDAYPAFTTVCDTLREALDGILLPTQTCYQCVLAHLGRPT